ncbi:hypothetical protein RclHR1_06520008 [Rhizophagus clarus]|uniref:Protein kinase domain-containing protein n=1 Tax=Rhizophagus clarus TaxID=94130 RepID=A0A2Z6SA83_9GLOM|nr:hypothetical protein RclHR1_06520008 [Rhizophagus clarus]
MFEKIRNFKNWTSGNHNVDKFIQDTQRSAHTIYEIKNVIEWIPNDRFCNIEYIAKGGFGKVYKANWIDGCIDKWSSDNRNWRRKDQYKFVALKILNNSENVASEFMHEITSHCKVDNFVVKLYGISQDPKTKNYIMVLDYAKDGDTVHMVFGIIMYEVISGLPPYYDMSHDNNLAIKICQGFRPKFNIKVPQLIVQLIKRCLDANSSSRPEAKVVKKTLSQWSKEVIILENYKKINICNNYTELNKQIIETENVNKNSSINSISSTSLGLSYKTHPKAYYTSRLLNFNNLPEPKNSYDYYEKNDDIISKEFLESLQIDIYQLNMNYGSNGKE